MINRLLFMRHAKSSWDNAALTDHERPLNEQGQRAATKIGEVLTARKLAPDMIWSSDSKRTRETAMRLIRAIPGAQTVRYFGALYHGGIEDVLSLCQTETEPNGALMLLGHNPGWSSLYTHYADSVFDFPTAACAVFTRTKSQAPWYDPSCWRPIDLLLPRELMA